MVTVASLLEVAAGENGYTETPNNVTKYWAELDPPLQGEPWCGAYVSWVFRHAGAPLPAVDKPYGFVYCPDMESWARRNGRWRTTPQRGFVVLYGTTQAVHTGIVDQLAAGGQFYAWEGNTELANDTDGGHVMRRLRGPGWVRGFVDLSIPEGVKPMFSPPLQMIGAVTHPKTGGTACLLADGGIANFNAPFCGNVVGKPYFGGRTAAEVRVNPNWDQSAHNGTDTMPWYVIVDTAGEVYGLGGF